MISATISSITFSSASSPRLFLSSSISCCVSCEEVRKEQEQRKETQEKEDLEEKKIGNTQFVSILEVNDVRRNYFMEKINGTYKPSFPYASYADGNTINYNGVVFSCDSEKNAICLGDMSNRGNVLTIPLEGGGSLMVNRNAIGMLAPFLHCITISSYRKFRFRLTVLYLFCDLLLFLADTVHKFLP